MLLWAPLPCNKALPDERRRAIDDSLSDGRQMMEKEMEVYRKQSPHGRVVMLTNADQHCFIDRESEVLREIRTVLSK